MFLSEKTVGVIGFNARPIACSAKRLGAKVLVSDYWGDADLSDCCHEWVSVLNPHPGQRQRVSLETPVHQALVQNFLGNFTESVDAVFLGSGFDDHPESVRMVETHLPLVGNDSASFQRARDRDAVTKLATRFGFKIPESSVVYSTDEALAAALEIGYPCVCRRLFSGGGTGIRFVRNEQALRELLNKKSPESFQQGFIIQQYVPGLDCSATVLATKKKAITLSLQGQLIGIPSAGRNCDFVYCGNYWPLSLPVERQEMISESIAKIIKKLELIGINGIDFVLGKENVWFLEVNPRITGTLEMLEVSSGLNLLTMHIQACQGTLPTLDFQLQPVVKMIVYARRTGQVPELYRFSGTVDRTPVDVKVEYGDPICSVISTGQTLQDCFRMTYQTAMAIQLNIKKLPKNE